MRMIIVMPNSHVNDSGDVIADESANHTVKYRDNHYITHNYTFNASTLWNTFCHTSPTTSAARLNENIPVVVETQ